MLIPPEVDPLINHTVGGYKVLRRLGVGGMGAVYEGHEPNIDKRVALKVVHPHLNDDPRLPTLLAEAKAINAIGDRGIVDVYGYGTLPDGRSYLVMELLEGEVLEARLLREKRLGIIESIDLLLPLLDALEAAHAAGFVHRDIKPANVFIVERPPREPFPKLLDFGIAKRVKVTAHEALGTLAYIAPEQAMNKNVGAKADLYALGCVMFEMMSGQLPFPAQGDAFSIVRQHTEAKRPSLRHAVKEAPASLDALVASMMSVNPAGRPPSAASVRASLAHIRQNIIARQKRRWVPWAIVALLALIAAMIFLLTQPLQPVETTLPATTAQPQAVDPMSAAVAAAAADVERAFQEDPQTAVDPLLAAEASFPGRQEWVALRGSIGAKLRTQIQTALANDDADGALHALSLLSRLGPLAPTDPLEVQAKRLSFAQHAGMVRVGDVFIDRYEYPNRAGALPTTKVDWAEAVKLCKAAGKHLCTEREWEVACRGEKHFNYPYGSKLDKRRCHSKTPRSKGPREAGASPGCVSPAGVFDLSGNVAEWTASPFREGAPQRAIRGGSFAQSDARLACGARDYSLPGLGGAKHLGLRCCL